MKRVNWHGVAAGLALLFVWRYWLMTLGRDLRLGWCAAIVSIIYGTIIVVNAVQLPDNADQKKRRRKKLVRNAGSFGAHLFLLLVIIFNWKHISNPSSKDSTGHLIFSVVAALAIGMLLPFMVILRDLPQPSRTWQSQDGSGSG